MIDEAVDLINTVSTLETAYHRDTTHRDFAHTYTTNSPICLHFYMTNRSA